MKTLLATLGLLVAVSAQAQQKDMTFFITSVGPGNGADLGGLAGADAHCQKLAQAAGAGEREWRAYLSTDKANARDRIGKGPWKNAKGEEIAKSVDDLHKDPKINKQTGLDEKGNTVNGRGDSPNKHDILTGSTPDGRAIAYVDPRDTVSNVVARPIDGGAVKQLTNFKADRTFSFDWSRDGSQLALSRGTQGSDVILIKYIH